MKKDAASHPWFRTHFNEDYLILYASRTQAKADREVAFLARELKIQRDDTVLDLCCGLGRHLRAFHQLGIAAIGVDLSASLLSLARERIENDLVSADMRELPFRGRQDGFSVVVNFFTSFGYFDTEPENIKAAREIARVLRPEGRFSLDLINPEPTKNKLVPYTERQFGPYKIEEERSYDDHRKRIEKTILMRHTDSGLSRSYFESVRLYTEDEIVELLERVGLTVTRIFGGFDGSPRTPESDRMIVAGSRRKS